MTVSINGIFLLILDRRTSSDSTLASLNIRNSLLKSVFDLIGSPSRDVAVEDEVDLFKSPASRLRIHEEDVDSHDRAKDAENYIRPPGYVGECRSNEESEREVEDPIRCR